MSEKSEIKGKGIESLTKKLYKLSLTNDQDYINLRKSVERDFPDIDLVKRLVDEFMKKDKITERLSRCLIAAYIVEVIGDLVFERKTLKFRLVAPVLGFGELGISRGSLAASAQAHYGDVEAGSIIAKMTSKAMKDKYL